MKSWKLVDWSFHFSKILSRPTLRHSQYENEDKYSTEGRKGVPFISKKGNQNSFYKYYLAV